MLRWLRRGAAAIGAGLFATLFVVFLVQITARFGFNQPLPWTDEAAVMLYVWVILWAAAFVVPEREHVMFDLVWNAVGRRARAAMRVLGHALIGGLAAWALPASWTTCISWGARARRCWASRSSGCSCPRAAARRAGRAQRLGHRARAARAGPRGRGAADVSTPLLALGGVLLAGMLLRMRSASR